ncbi:DNA-directed RNA polymerase III subunit RPC5-like isoform X2 [Solanum pennellii]|uniref:DNA-directed RNA polymerase III subunit RPC5-like isoform X2 n=1 Tax=Solanum pennellii TaxID=28526 RepID=A0ABM1HC94_SOLPN|nr:DNA-directed RNA polymerase III subunit RPC5-like isoform X2 [Solanum pennellii]
MDLDFDGPSKVPTRQSRFAPKSSKLKPQPETKPKIETLPQSDSAISTKKEELTVHLAENGAVTGNDDVPLEGETTGNDLGEDEEQVTDSDHDEVVREIDVCINPSFDPSTQLYVFQYPLRAVWRPYELEERCQEVRLRPSTAEMEVDLAIDLDSKNFDRDSVHAATIKKQMLSTSWMPLPTCASGYAVGVLIGDKLHLNPVHAVVQLRPSKRNLKESELKKNVITNNDEKSVENEDVKEKRPVGPSKKQHWLHLKYHGARSDISARYLQKMAMEEGSPVPFSMSPVDYLNAFCPGRPTDTDRLKILRTRLSQLPLEERVRIWLLEGPPIHRFDALMHLAPDNSADEIIRVLQIYAQLVQGLWVPKSSLVYGTNSGVEVLARNFVLYEFTKGILIKKSVFGRRPEFLKAATPALKSLAVERPDLNDWKLKEHPDKKFENLYGDVVREQQATWECLGKQINDVLPGGRTRPTMKNPINRDADITALPPSGDKPTSSSLLRTSMSEEIREALPKALQEVFRTYKVCSFQQIRQGLRKLGVSKSYPPKGAPRKAITASVDVFDAPQEEIQAVINQVAVNIHGVYVLKSSPDNPQYDTLRKIVIDLFMAEGPSAKLKKASVTEAAKLQLNRDITNVEFLKVMKELCHSEKSAWVLRSGDGKPE